MGNRRSRQWRLESERQAVSFAGVPPVFTWPQHPDDDHVWNLAIAAKADYLVTWETKLLKLEAGATPAAGLFRRLAPQLSIITPKQLADRLKAQAPPSSTS